MKKIFLISVICFCCGTSVFAQIYSDKPLLLNGSASGDRQIENLSLPDSMVDIVPSEVLLKNTGRFGITSGIDSLLVSIPSGLSMYTPGNIIYFRAVASNTGPVSISINGLPSFPLTVYGSNALKAGQLKAGQVYCVIFSGAEFQLLSAPNNDCRAGFVEANSTYCIEINERTADNLWNAMITCTANNARLCKWGEWYYACQKAGLGLLNTTNNNWEWTDDGANATVRIVGRLACEDLNVGNIGVADFRTYRCCYSK